MSCWSLRKTMLCLQACRREGGLRLLLLCCVDMTCIMSDAEMLHMVLLASVGTGA